MIRAKLNLLENLFFLTPSVAQHVYKSVWERCVGYLRFSLNISESLAAWSDFYSKAD